MTGETVETFDRLFMKAVSLLHVQGYVCLKLVFYFTEGIGAWAPPHCRC